jgi:N-acetylglucosaminyl-diphospho-decaprenol L-rhamnosyltransferase
MMRTAPFPRAAGRAARWATTVFAMTADVLQAPLPQPVGQDHHASALAVVIVTHNSAAAIAATLHALAAQLAPGDDVIVVDNASTDGTEAAVRAAAPWARIVQTGENAGFAVACNIGVAASSAPLVLLLNPDAAPKPGCLDALRRAGVEHAGWAAWQALVTMEGGTRINTAGGVVHFLGFGWAGRCGEPVPPSPRPAHVTFASGAAMCVRREAWDALGGFDPDYFMYCEDLELSLRLWLAGWEVGIEPRARVEHGYDFAKGAMKWFLLERNRWQTVLATYPGPLLALVLPALLAFDVALLPIARRDGWLGAKLRADAAVVRALPRIFARRRRVQAARRISAAEFAAHLTAGLDSPYLAVPSWARGLAALQRRYWALARALLAASNARS